MPTVEVFADVLCPFTHVGLRRFVERREALDRPDVGLLVRAWPLEIVNGVPLDASFVAEEIDEIRAQVAPGLFEGFSVASFPATSLPAMALADLAYQHDVHIGEAVSLDLRRRVFELGLDVSARDVLADVASDHDLEVDVSRLDPAPVLADHAAGVALGVVGSPYFLVRDEGYFCPGLSVSRDAQGHLRITTDATRFEGFLDRCFEPPS